MTPLRFIDTNILLRLITADQPLQAELADHLFLKMADGEVQGILSMTVLFETSYLLEGYYQLGRNEVDQSIRFVTGARGVRLLDGEMELLDRTLKLYMQIPQLSFADCYHAVLALELCDGEIYTFDREFRRVPGITRLEPGE